MKKLFLVAAAASALCVPSAASAMEVTVQNGLDAAASATGTVSPPGGSMGAAPMQSGSPAMTAKTPYEVIALIPTSTAEVEAIKKASAETKVGVIKLSVADKTSALSRAETTQKEELTKLHEAINANSELKAGLTAQGVQVNTVIAADVAADGSLLLYASG